VPRLVFTHSAQINLFQIADYVESTSGSLAVAERFTDDLMAKCRELAALPGTMGPARPELLADLRSTPHGNYVIFFRYVGDVFEVVNILEGHRDIEGYFKNRP
jgi:toxin ParE1/3/4